VKEEKRRRRRPAEFIEAGYSDLFVAPKRPVSFTGRNQIHIAGHP
jgi:hypothetical protein